MPFHNQLLQPPCRLALENVEVGCCFEGTFEGQVMDTILRWVEHALDDAEVATPTKKRAFRCAVEVIQNLSKHGRRGSFSFAIHGDGSMQFSSVNAVDDLQRDDLNVALEEANRLPLEELREQRLKKLAHGSRTDKGGAGLGLLDLRACSEDRVYTEFIPCSNELQWFVLTVEVPLTT